MYYVGPSKWQTWKHVYTAVTRGRRAVHVLGKRDEFTIAVKKEPFSRFTRLKER